MTKIIFNNDGIRTSITPQIGNALDDLAKAIDNCSQMYIPAKFKHTTYLNELKEKISSIHKSLEQIKSAIESTNSNLDYALSETDASIKAIEDVKLNKRQPAIRQ